MFTSLDEDDTLMSQIEGFVLAGGASQRMGEPKYKLEIGGKSFVERAAAALRAITTGQIIVVGEIDARYLKVKLSEGDDRELRKIPDIIISGEFGGEKARRGALIGLYTALTHAKSRWIAVLACDLPFVTGDLMTRIADCRSMDFDAIVPVQPDTKMQPLCAFYRRERCKPMVEKMITDGDFKMQRLIFRLRTRFVKFDEIADLHGSSNFFLNVNRPDDYEAALKILPG